MNNILFHKKSTGLFKKDYYGRLDAVGTNVRIYHYILQEIEIDYLIFKKKKFIKLYKQSKNGEGKIECGACDKTGVDNEYLNICREYKVFSRERRLKKLLGNYG